MKFYVRNIMKDFTGNLLYDKKENSFIYEPFETIDFSIMIGGAYVGLDISLKTMKVLAVSGYSPMDTWVKSLLTIPNKIDKFELYVHADKQWHQGEGTSYAEWQAYYDPDSKWVCIGNKEIRNSLFVEFANNCFAVINQNQVYSIYLKPEFI
ncbi:hypothetical protein [Faecalispora jeddahensis]|uniref:hypothetical protein n=1 Tax=Faecalispora jeddahensis TaxID=1414721 RepID=UPI00145B3732|nr:hypothetical protein [Faecalispora jeddahensis]MBE6742814.1 hypothetical protein [Oscillospiraceae bacterium]